MFVLIIRSKLYTFYCTRKSVNAPMNFSFVHCTSVYRFSNNMFWFLFVPLPQFFRPELSFKGGGVLCSSLLISAPSITRPDVKYASAISSPTSSPKACHGQRWLLGMIANTSRSGVTSGSHPNDIRIEMESNHPTQ